jgi:hypothetical protein
VNELDDTRARLLGRVRKKGRKGRNIPAKRHQTFNSEASTYVKVVYTRSLTERFKQLECIFCDSWIHGWKLRADFIKLLAPKGGVLLCMDGRHVGSGLC